MLVVKSHNRLRQSVPAYAKVLSPYRLITQTIWKFGTGDDWRLHLKRGSFALYASLSLLQIANLYLL